MSNTDNTETTLTAERAAISGVFNCEDLRRLQWPIAWAAGVSEERKHAVKCDLLNLSLSGLHSIGATDGAAAVEVTNGEITAVVIDPDNRPGF